MSATLVGRIQPEARATLSEAYNHRFDVIFATSPTLMEKAYRLRYQVYCRERRYEDPTVHSLEMETDIFDGRSIHSLIIDRISGTVLGTVRLVLPDPRELRSSFPIQRICANPLILNIASRAAEVSRFAVSKTTRTLAKRCVSSALCRKQDTVVEGNDLKCSVTLGLMRATVQMSMENGITDWFAVMEPSLLRLLSRFGIHFTPIGPLVEYHGLRQPCHANLDNLLERVRQENRGLWEFVAEPDPARMMRN